MDIIAALHIALFGILLGYILATAPESSGKGPWGRFVRKRSPREAKREKSPRVLMVLVAIVSLIFLRDVIVGSTPFGNTTIGSVLEKREYREMYVVYAFPEGSDEMGYRVKAEIHSTLEYGAFGADRLYALDQLRLPGGSIVTFSDQESGPVSLVPHYPVHLVDDSGRTWRIELTEVKAD